MTDTERRNLEEAMRTDTDRRAAAGDRRALPSRREAGRRLSDAIETARELLAQVDAEQRQAERMLKIAQVARMAGVSPRTVWNDIAKGALKVERTLIGVRHRVRITVQEARRYAALG